MKKQITSEQLREVLRARAIEAKSLRRLAAKLGVSPAYLSKVLTRNIEPGPTICKALGYRLVLAYEQQPPKEK